MHSNIECSQRWICTYSNNRNAESNNRVGVQTENTLQQYQQSDSVCFSVLFWAITDSNCRLTTGDVDSVSRQNDAGNFRTSSPLQIRGRREVNVPLHSELPGTVLNVSVVLQKATDIRCYLIYGGHAQEGTWRQETCYLIGNLLVWLEEEQNSLCNNVYYMAKFAYISMHLRQKTIKYL
jgi:hypothetical protein